MNLTDRVRLNKSTENQRNRERQSDVLHSKRIRKAIADGGDSPKDAARRTGISYTTVLKYMNGHVMPTAYNIYLICRVYGYSADELFGLEGR